MITSAKSLNAKEIDDHNLHINEHTAFMLSSDYEKAFAKNAKVETVLLEHIRSHKKFLNIMKEINDGE